MKWQFQREAHNRQDKVRNEWAISPRGPTSTSSCSFFINSYGELDLKPAAKAKHFKSRIISQFQEDVRRMRFRFHGYVFCPNEDLRGFCQANRISVHDAKHKFDEIHSDFEERLGIVLAQMRRAKIQFQTEWDKSERRMVEIAILPCHLAKVFDLAENPE